MSHPIGILGESGLYAVEGLTSVARRTAETPFGAPSGPLVQGYLEGIEVVFLARHGEGHPLLPHEVPYRANLWALKSLGVEAVISFSAVGSLQERHPPGSLRLPDQFVDRTFCREATFFGEGLVAHVGFADPTSAWLRGVLPRIAQGPPADEPARTVLRTALVIRPERVPEAARIRLNLLIGKYGY